MAVKNILRIIAGDVLSIGSMKRAEDRFHADFYTEKPPNCELFGADVNAGTIQRMQERFQKYSIQSKLLLNFIQKSKTEDQIEGQTD